MKDKKQRGFAKGVSPNPNGRPKGTLNKSTSEYLKMKELATNDYQKVYMLLLDKIEAGEGWAFNLFFKELVPKRQKEDSVVIKWTDGPIEEQLAALLEGYKSFKELTPENVLSAIKVLSDIKGSKENADQIQRIAESKEELWEQIKRIEKAKNYVNYVEKENVCE